MGIKLQCQLDSLRSLLAITDNSKNKIDLLLDIAHYEMGTSLDSSMTSTKRALSIAQKTNDDENIGRCLTWMSRVLEEQGKYNEALATAERAEKIFLSIPDSFYLGNIYNIYGIIYLKMDDLQSAIEYQFKAAAFSQAVENTAMAASSYNSLGNLYTRLRDIKTALEYYLKAANYANISGNTRSQCGVYLNMANIAEDSLSYRMELYNKALTIGKKYGYHRELGYIYNGMAFFYSDEKHDLDSSNYYFKLAIDESTQAGDNYITSYSQMYLGVNQQQIGEPLSAEKLLRNSILNDYVLSDPSLNAEVHYYLSRSLADQSKYALAYPLLDSALTQYRINYDENILIESAEANAKYETERKEKEIAEQALIIEQAKNNRNVILLLGAVLLGFGSLLAQYFINKEKRQKRETEQALSLEKQRNTDLQEISKVKIDLFNNISHELRTPLSMIISPLEEAVKKLQNIHVKNDISLALKNSRRLTGLVNEILDLSKIDAGKLEMDISEVKLISFLKRVFYSFASLADSQQIILKDNLKELVFADGIQNIFIKTDVLKLEKILNNLISNAIKFSKSGDTIDFILDENKLDENQLSIAIKDEGAGIPENEIDKIFDRFYQSSNTSSAYGTGIGLALVKELCLFLGGDISVQSVECKGSKFTLVFPVVTRKAQNSKVETEAQIPNFSTIDPILISGNKPELLIVEDDLQMAKYLKKLLYHNYECTIAYNGQQALNLLRKKSFDLISSDIMMPEMDGFQFKKEVNNLDQSKDTPFIMLTARVLEDDKLKGLKMGIDDYITKPFSADELKARIHNLIKNKISRSEESPELTYEAAIIQKAKDVILDHIDDTTFKVDDLAKELSYSSRQLSRIFKKATGFSPVEFILEIRLQSAYKIIQERKFSTINEVRYEVGIDSPSYFTTKFKERFGINPSAVSSAM
ncbi:MAG: ATP-binding protein [Saprospiraceae bacterium]